MMRMNACGVSAVFLSCFVAVVLVLPVVSAENLPGLEAKCGSSGLVPNPLREGRKKELCQCSGCSARRALSEKEVSEAGKSSVSATESFPVGDVPVKQSGLTKSVKSDSEGRAEASTDTDVATAAAAFTAHLSGLVREGGALARVVARDASQLTKEDIERVARTNAARLRAASREVWGHVPEQEEVRRRMVNAFRVVESRAGSGMEVAVASSQKAKLQLKAKSEKVLENANVLAGAVEKELHVQTKRGIEVARASKIVAQKVLGRELKRGAHLVDIWLARASFEWRNTVVPGTIRAARKAQEIGAARLEEGRTVVVFKVIPAVEHGLHVAMGASKRISVTVARSIRQDVIPRIIHAGRSVLPAASRMLLVFVEFVEALHGGLNAFSLQLLSSWEFALQFMRQSISWAVFAFRMSVFSIFLYAAFKTWKLFGQLSAILPATGTLVDYFGTPVWSLLPLRGSSRGGPQISAETPAYAGTRDARTPSRLPDAVELAAKRSPTTAAVTGDNTGVENRQARDTCGRDTDMDISEEEAPRRYSVPSPHAPPPARRRMDDIRFRYIPGPTVVLQEPSHGQSCTSERAVQPAPIPIAAPTDQTTLEEQPVRRKIQKHGGVARKSQNVGQVRLPSSPESDTSTEVLPDVALKPRLRVPRKVSGIPRPVRRSARPLRAREISFNEANIIDIDDE